MSMASNIVPRQSTFVEDFDKIFDECPKTERQSEPAKVEKSYTFKVKVDEPKPQNKDKKEFKEFKKNLKDMLKDEVKKYCDVNAKHLYATHLQKRREEQAKVVHQVGCKECGAEEIVGVRYKCTQRPDYDICEKCEEKHGANSIFSFIKIRKPEMAPVHLVCQYGN